MPVHQAKLCSIKWFDISAPPNDDSVHQEHVPRHAYNMLTSCPSDAVTNSEMPKLVAHHHTLCLAVFDKP